MIGTIIAIVIMYFALKWHSKAMNANTFDCYEKMKEAWASGHKMKAVGLALLFLGLRWDVWSLTAIDIE